MTATEALSAWYQWLGSYALFFAIWLLLFLTVTFSRKYRERNTTIRTQLSLVIIWTVGTLAFIYIK